MPKKGGLEQFADLRGRGLGKKEGRGGDFGEGGLTCYPQSPNMPIMFLFLAKRKERLHEAYRNIELATHFYDNKYSFITKLEKDKHLHIFNFK